MKQKSHKEIPIERLVIAQRLIDSFNKLFSNIDNIGLFFIGAYGASGDKALHKAIGGIKGLIGYRLAQQGNLAVGATGLAWTVATLSNATTKAFAKTRGMPKGYWPGFTEYSP